MRATDGCLVNVDRVELFREAQGNIDCTDGNNPAVNTVAHGLTQLSISAGASSMVRQIDVLENTAPS